jgi:hypothetical protein
MIVSCVCVTKQILADSCKTECFPFDMNENDANRSVYYWNVMFRKDKTKICLLLPEFCKGMYVPLFVSLLCLMLKDKPVTCRSAESSGDNVRYNSNVIEAFNVSTARKQLKLPYKCRYWLLEASLKICIFYTCLWNKTLLVSAWRISLLCMNYI